MTLTAVAIWYILWGPEKGYQIDFTQGYPSYTVCMREASKIQRKINETIECVQSVKRINAQK